MAKPFSLEEIRAIRLRRLDRLSVRFAARATPAPLNTRQRRRLFSLSRRANGQGGIFVV